MNRNDLLAIFKGEILDGIASFIRSKSYRYANFSCLHVKTYITRSVMFTILFLLFHIISPPKISYVDVSGMYYHSAKQFCKLYIREKY